MLPNAIQHKTQLRAITRFSRFAAVAVAAALSLSGCKFGNHEIDPPGPLALQGNYESQIDSKITICATKPVTTDGNTTEQTNCASVASSNVSWLFTETMTDPVYMAFDSTHGLFLLEPPNNPNPDFYFIMESDLAGNLGNPGTSYTPFSYLMPDTHPDCDFNMQYMASGTYGKPGGPFTTNTTLPLLGRIAMNFDLIFSPNGTDCAQLEACYNNASACDQTDNQIVQSEFSPFINAGLITVTDIPNVQSLEYQVSYQ